MPSVTSHTLAQDPSWMVLDIRPFSERMEPALGFIPGSLSMPLTPEGLGAALPVALRSAKAALVCTSGHRSDVLLRAIHDRFGHPLHHLEGGILRWLRDGFPVAGTPDVKPAKHPVPPNPTLEQFPRLMASCFVGQLIASSLDEADISNIDPLLILRQCFSAEHVCWDNPDLAGLYRVIDRAALTSRFANTPLLRVCENINWALAALQKISPRPPLRVEPAV